MINYIFISHPQVDVNRLKQPWSNCTDFHKDSAPFEDVYADNYQVEYSIQVLHYYILKTYCKNVIDVTESSRSRIMFFLSSFVDIDLKSKMQAIQNIILPQRVLQSLLRIKKTPEQVNLVSMNCTFLYDTAITIIHVLGRHIFLLFQIFSYKINCVQFDFSFTVALIKLSHTLSLEAYHFLLS